MSGKGSIGAFFIKNFFFYLHSAFSGRQRR